jgi:hypothetical protein
MLVLSSYPGLNYTILSFEIVKDSYFVKSKGKDVFQKFTLYKYISSRMCRYYIQFKAVLGFVFISDNDSILGIRRRQMLKCFFSLIKGSSLYKWNVTKILTFVTNMITVCNRNYYKVTQDCSEVKLCEMLWFSYFSGFSRIKKNVNLLYQIH